jgi:hypothetical protein
LLKTTRQTFDAGIYFQICQRVDEADELLGYKAICINENGLKSNDPTG